MKKILISLFIALIVISVAAISSFAALITTSAYAQPAQWNYSFNSSGQAQAYYPGNVLVGGSIAGVTNYLTIGSTVVSGGTNQYIEYDNNGILGEIPITGSSPSIASLLGLQSAAYQPTSAFDAAGVGTNSSNQISGTLPSGRLNGTYSGLFLSSGQITAGLGYTPPTPTGSGASGTWGINVTGNAATATTASAAPLSGLTGAGTGVLTAAANAVNAAGGFATSGNAFSIAGATGLTSSQVLTALGYTPANPANVCLLTGCSLSGAISAPSAQLQGLSLGSTTGSGTSATLSSASGYYRQFSYYTGSSARWSLDVDSSAESGSNAGSNFIMYAYADSGSYLYSVLSCTRASGVCNFSSVPTAGPSNAPLAIQANGTTCNVGYVGALTACTISTTGASLAVGSTAISGGVSGNVLYANGSTLGSLSPCVTINTVSACLGSSATITATAASITVGATGVNSGASGDLLGISGSTLAQFSTEGTGAVVLNSTLSGYATTSALSAYAPLSSATFTGPISTTAISTTAYNAGSMTTSTVTSYGFTNNNGPSLYMAGTVNSSLGAVGTMYFYTPSSGPTTTMGPTGLWTFPSRPTFGGATPWDSSNLASPLTTSVAASTYATISSLSSYAALSGATFTGGVTGTTLTLTGTGLLASSSLEIANTGGGAWYMSNTASGATTPNKYFRIGTGGDFEIVNSAYSAVIFSIADNGNLADYGNLSVAGTSTYTGSTNTQSCAVFGDGNNPTANDCRLISTTASGNKSQIGFAVSLTSNAVSTSGAEAVTAYFANLCESGAPKCWALATSQQLTTGSAGGVGEEIVLTNSNCDPGVPWAPSSSCMPSAGASSLLIDSIGNSTSGVSPNEAAIYIVNSTAGTAFHAGIMMGNNAGGYSGISDAGIADYTQDTTVYRVGNSHTHFYTPQTSTGLVASYSGTMWDGELTIGDSSESGPMISVANSTATCIGSPSTGAFGWSCSSDARLKTDYGLAGDQLAYLDSLPVHAYKINATGEKTIGPIAQELQKIHPEMVHDVEDDIVPADKENAAGTMLSVDEVNPWAMIKAIQELHVIVIHQRGEIYRLQKHRRISR